MSRKPLCLPRNRRPLFLPCPFCGSSNVDAYELRSLEDCHVRCEDCGAMIETKVPQNIKFRRKRARRALAKLWNRRAVTMKSEVRERAGEAIQSSGLWDRDREAARYMGDRDV